MRFTDCDYKFDMNAKMVATNILFTVLITEGSYVMNTAEITALQSS